MRIPVRIGIGDRGLKILGRELHLATIEPTAPEQIRASQRRLRNISRMQKCAIHSVFAKSF